MLDGFYDGIHIQSGKNTVVSNNLLVNNYPHGIYIAVACNNISIINNTIESCGNGIFLYDRIYECNISENIIRNTSRYYGIDIGLNAENNTISNNYLENNSNEGIFIWKAKNNLISLNHVINNRIGIRFDNASYNVITYNNFIDNKINAFFIESTNIWNHNYWNRPRILPKIIFGLPFPNIDWGPVNNPLDDIPHWDEIFKLEIYPYDGLIEPEKEPVEIKGFHKFIGNPIKELFPIQAFWRYTTLKVKFKPDWATVALPNVELFSHPDGRRNNFSIYVSVSKDAPAYDYGMISLEIKSGSYWKEMIGLPLRYNLDKDIPVMPGFYPLLYIEQPQPLNISIGEEEISILNITNLGNARSEVIHDVNYSNIPDFVSLIVPPPLILNLGDTIHMPYVFSVDSNAVSSDDWYEFPINIEVLSTLEGSTGPVENYNLTFLIKIV